jgi:hypothetical protein
LIERANVVLPSYASLLNSINTIYEAIDWSTFNNIIIRGTLTPYFKISNILPFGNIFDDLFPYIGFDNINTISYVDFSNLIITSSENYSASEHKNVSSIWNSSSKNSNGIVNMSSLLAYKNYLKQTTTPFRYDHEMFKQCINLNTKRSDVDKIYTDFMGDPNDTLSFNPIYVVKYEYEKENGKVVTKVVDNFRNAVVSHLTGKHTVIHYNSSLGLSSKIVEDQIKQIQEEYQRLHFCQGVLIIPTDSNGMINSQGYILRNKLLTSMILRNSNEKIFQVSSETFSNDMGNYVRINKFYNSIQTINNTVLNFDIHDINLFNSELPALIKRFSTNFGSIKSLMNKNQKRILQFY